MNKQFSLRAIMMNALATTLIGIGVTPVLQHRAYAVHEDRGMMAKIIAAPIATSGDNIYITWSANKTGNDEVMFRASTDNGATFGDNINLSNSTKSESQDVQIDASGDKVFVTWWERNQTSDIPVMRISTDNGKTFGPILKLATNGTIGSSGSG
jgi:uncharacterized protein (UPF0333 family)